jgi:type VI secretion system secreted protein Hcp
MASDIFLKFDGIDGESTDDAHAREITVESFSWGESQTGAPSGASTPRGKVQMQEAIFVIKYSKASPQLFFLCASGTRAKNAVLSIRKRSSQTNTDYLIYTFTDILVSGYQTGVSADSLEALPLDQIRLAFSRIQIEYKEQRPDGTFGNPVKAGWDLKQNTSA